MIKLPATNQAGTTPMASTSTESTNGRVLYNRVLYTGDDSMGHQERGARGIV
jgi:hypothetical protein